MFSRENDMKKNCILSVCIPTNNRAIFLKKNLEALSKIVETDMEIVIGDDCSSDNTEDIVKEFSKNNPKLKIKYLESKERIFFDRNALKIVEAASGRFCWMLGDDDLPKKESIKKIKSVIIKYPNLSLIYLNYSRFDNLLKKITAPRMVQDITRDTLFANGQDFYFAKTPKSYFKFLGTNTITLCTDVINRKKWLYEAKKIKKYIGHNFIHSFIIGKMINRSKSVYFISTPLVQYLANNSRVWPNNVWKDYNNVFLGYLQNNGYEKEKIRQMIKSNKENEQKEAFMKNKIFGLIYLILRPLYTRLQLLISKNE
jgi:abequosyltransferase